MIVDARNLESSTHKIHLLIQTVKAQVTRRAGQDSIVYIEMPCERLGPEWKQGGRSANLKIFSK